jgi:sodium/potassium-transporting ATPase subunit alpha
MKSIKNMMPHSALVIRNGHETKILVDEVVVGDLVCLTYGHKVPADIRLTESHDLKFDKSMLTGESEAVEGTVECTDDRYVESKNIAYMTSLVTSGHGKGIVVATGNNTFMGKIATLTSSTRDKQSSLQKEIQRFVFFVSLIAFISMIILVIFWAKWLRVHHPKHIDTPSIMIQTMSLIVAYIPTGIFSVFRI